MPADEPSTLSSNSPTVLMFNWRGTPEIRFESSPGWLRIAVAITDEAISFLTGTKATVKKDRDGRWPLLNLDLIGLGRGEAAGIIGVVRNSPRPAEGLETSGNNPFEPFMKEVAEVSRRVSIKTDGVALHFPEGSPFADQKEPEPLAPAPGVPYEGDVLDAETEEDDDDPDRSAQDREYVLHHLDMEGSSAHTDVTEAVEKLTRTHGQYHVTTRRWTQLKDCLEQTLKIVEELQRAPD